MTTMMEYLFAQYFCAYVYLLQCECDNASVCSGGEELGNVGGDETCFGGWSELLHQS